MNITNKHVSLALNSLIIIFEIIGLILSINSLSWMSFAYYTVLSNILLLISSIMYLYYNFTNKNSKKLELLKYSATVSITLTFLVVIFILSWITSEGLFHLLFDGVSLYFHTLCPIIAIITFIFFENYNLDSNDIIKSVYFTIIYSVIMILLNILRIVDGPYPFLRVYNQSLLSSIGWLISILLLTMAIAAVLRMLNQNYGKNNI